MATPTLTRAQLGAVFKDQRVLLAFDQFQKQIAAVLPDQITALAALQYIVAATDPLLPNAHALVAGSGLSGTAGIGVFTLNVTSAPKWTTARTLSLTGDGSASLSVDGSANASGALTLASIISAGSATKVSFNAKGLVNGSSSAVLASSDFLNQGATNTVLHGNAAGAPSWGAVVLTSDVSGTLPVANGGTGDTGTAWTAYTPTLTAGSGTLTTASATGRYKLLGKTLFIEAEATITTNGTGATSLILSLPSPLVGAATAYILAGREIALTGAAFTGTVNGGSTITLVKYDNTYGVGNGSVVAVSGVIEVL